MTRDVRRLPGRGAVIRVRVPFPRSDRGERRHARRPGRLGLVGGPGRVCL